MENPLFIHILSDYTADAPEHGIYQAVLYSQFPFAKLITSNQPFKKGDTLGPGVFLTLVNSDFPPGTFHLCILHMDSRLPRKYVLASHNNQYFLAPDNGIVPLAFENETEYFKLPCSKDCSDVMKQVYLPALQEFTKTGNTGFLEPEDKPRRLLMPLPPINGNTYKLSVLYNDSHGNAYLNLSKQEFERISAGKKFTLKLSMRETIETISNSYYNVHEGEKLALFGFGDLLQIAINCGSAVQYLGLKTGQMVILEII